MGVKQSEHVVCEICISNHLRKGGDSPTIQYFPMVFVLDNSPPHRKLKPFYTKQVSKLKPAAIALEWLPALQEKLHLMAIQHTIFTPLKLQKNEQKLVSDELKQAQSNMVNLGGEY
ncbi:hypothetical protein SDJN03_14587, partial [Cucurbita argyrosperma subsp. sororia]